MRRVGRAVPVSRYDGRKTGDKLTYIVTLIIDNSTYVIAQLEKQTGAR